jgi:hypothetical protein
MCHERRRLPSGTPDVPHADPTPEPVQVLCGPVLCRLEVWSEAEWAAMPESERPATSEHVVGLGWVGVVPAECMN